MSRSRMIKTLLAATTCGGLVLGQAANQTPPLESRLGKVITVQETNRPAEKCIIQQVWRSPEGFLVMKAQDISSSAMMTIVERPNASSASERFRVFHWVNGQPPQGCPMPPDTQVAKTPGSEAKPEKKEAKEVAETQKSWPAAHAGKKETTSSKSVEVAQKKEEPQKSAEPLAAKETARSDAKPAAKPADEEIVTIKMPEKAAKPATVVKASDARKKEEPQKSAEPPAAKETAKSEAKPAAKPADEEIVTIKMPEKVAKPATVAKASEARKKEEPEKTADAPAAKETAKSEAKPAAKPADEEIIMIKMPEKTAKPATVVKASEPEKITVKPTPTNPKTPASEKVAEKLKAEPAADKPVVSASTKAEKPVEKAAKPVAGEYKLPVEPSGDHVVAKPSTTPSKPAITAEGGDHVIAPVPAAPKPTPPPQVAQAPVAPSKPTPPPQPEYIGTSPYGGPTTHGKGAEAEHVAHSPYDGKGAVENIQAPKSASTVEHITTSPYTKDVSGGMSIAQTLPMPKPPVTKAGGDAVMRPPEKVEATKVEATPVSTSSASNPGDGASKNPPAKQPPAAPAPEVLRTAPTPANRDRKPAAAPGSQTERTKAPQDPERQTMTLKKPDGSLIKCVVQSEGVRGDGTRVTQVKAIDTGEVLTIVEQGQPPAASSSNSGDFVKRSVPPPTLAESGKPSYMQPTAPLPPEMEPPPVKPSLVQRIKDRIHGGDKVVIEPPHDKVAASSKTDERNPASSGAVAKRDETTVADKASAAQHESPKPAAEVDWHQSWGSDGKPKSSGSVAQATETDPLLNHDQYLRPGKSKSVEAAHKVEPPKSIAEAKSVEKSNPAKVEMSHGVNATQESAKKSEASVAPPLTPPAQPPVMTPPAMSAPKVAVTPPAVPEPAREVAQAKTAPQPAPVTVAETAKVEVPPAPPVIPEPKAEAPKVTLAPPMTSDTKPPEPRSPEIQVAPSAPIASATPVEQPKLPEPQMEPKPAPAEMPRIAETKSAPMELKPPETPMQEQPGTASIASSRNSKPNLLNDLAAADAGSARIAQTSMPPKRDMVSPEIKKQQAIRYTAVLMELLQNSGVPAEREMAAIQLRNADSSTHSLVNQALLQAVKSDPAPMVRVAAMQSLTAMKIFTPEVKAALEDAASERDPRVRDEAKVSLSLMSKPPEVRPAGYRH